MVDDVIFSTEGLEEYIYWQTEDRRTLKKINSLLYDIVRNGNKGIGHPKPLTADLSGRWSRKIDDKNRLVYEMLPDNMVKIHRCKGHYSDK